MPTGADAVAVAAQTYSAWLGEVEQLRFAQIPWAELRRQRRAQPLLQLLAKDIGRMVSQALKSSGGKKCG